MLDSGDNDTDYYRNLVLDFRIQQLQALMVFAGQTRSGKKEVLQDRALNLADLGSKTINLKIIELAKAQSRYRDVSQSSENTGASPSGMDSYSNPYTSPIPDSPPPTQNSPAASSSSSSIDSINSTTSSNHREVDGSLPMHPDVRLKPLPFFKIHDILLKPTSLQTTSNARLQDQTYQFYLTPSQANQISQSSCKNEKGRPEYRMQIQMRFSLLETSCLQEDYFPSSISVKVNSKMCPLPPIIPTNKAGAENRRPPKPVNITALCKLNSTSPNGVQVSWAVESAKMFTVSFYLVESLDYQDLLNSLKEKGERHPDFTKALIKEKLKDVDSEISTKTFKVSLACPLGKMRIRVPCRPNTCDHLQIFDAELFLQMNQKKPQWTCPICSKDALYESLYIDGYFCELIKSDRLPEGEHEVVLNEDGSWQPLPPKDENVQNIAGGASQACVPIDDDSENENHGEVNQTAAEDASNNKNTGVKRPFMAGDIITLDSDSETEEPEAKRAMYAPPSSPDSDIIVLSDVE